MAYKALMIGVKGQELSLLGKALLLGFTEEEILVVTTADPVNGTDVPEAVRDHVDKVMDKLTDGPVENMQMLVYIDMVGK